MQLWGHQSRWKCPVCSGFSGWGDALSDPPTATAKVFPQFAGPTIIMFLNFPRPCFSNSRRECAKNNRIYLIVCQNLNGRLKCCTQCCTHSVFAVWRMVSIRGTECCRSSSTAPFISHELVIKSCKVLLDRDMTKFASSFLPVSFWMLACAKSSVSVLTFLDTITSETSRLISLLTLGGFASFAGAFVHSTLLFFRHFSLWAFMHFFILGEPTSFKSG